MPRGGHNRIGFKHGEEAKIKLRQANIGKINGPHSQATKLRMSLAQKGRPSKLKGRRLPDDVRKKMSQARLGKVYKLPENLSTYSRQNEMQKLKLAKLVHTNGEWELLKKQYGHTCPACKLSEPSIKLTKDHIIPIRLGGTDVIENIQPLCFSCNCRKHTKSTKY